MTQILEIIKAALSLGLIFLDIVDSLSHIYKDVMDKIMSKYECAT